MQRVIVNVDTAGKVTVEAQGVQGKSCTDFTAAIERAIGSTVSDHKKPEFHHAGAQSHGQHAQH